jgi:hypothetical protein
MIRKLLIALAGLAASACTYGSAVDMAPMTSRAFWPTLVPGDYCEVQGTAAPFTVVSSADCVPLVWDGPSRSYTIADPDDSEDATIAAIVSLGSGLYLGQTEVETDTPDKFQLLVFIAMGDAFATLPALDDAPLKEVAAKHTEVSFARDGSGRPYIAAGGPREIKAFLRDAARRALLEMKKENEPLSLGIRDTAGAADHPATEQQQKHIEAVLKTAKSLTPK